MSLRMDFLYATAEEPTCVFQMALLLGAMLAFGISLENLWHPENTTNADHPAVDFPGIGLSRYRIAAENPHFLCDPLV